jgi:hypothetical protein
MGCGCTVKRAKVSDMRQSSLRRLARLHPRCPGGAHHRDCAEWFKASAGSAAVRDSLCVGWGLWHQGRASRSGLFLHDRVSTKR